MEKSPLRRSRRIQEKNKRIQEKNKEEQKKGDYVEHIYTLHSVTSEVHDMMSALDVNKLKIIISKYENIIGLLLDVE